ncbi:MAG: ABC transporter ATP-binding protein [Inquilinaceae bacterium]
MAGVTLTGLHKRFGDTAAVDDVTLSVGPGEFLALLGPSGCGKTTLLRLIAGFETADSGSIAIGGATMSGPSVHMPPEARRIAMVFQNYALWPHMDVAANVGYALKVRGLSRSQRRRKVGEALAAVGLADLADRRPASLSGGQRQRVALARCLAVDPALVLMDEPLANLDIHLRDSMQTEFRTFHKATGATMIYVTHDQAEAMALADRIAVLREGRVDQIADPQTLYRRPRTRAVAEFIGKGMVVPVEVLGADGPARVRASLWGHDVSLRADDPTPGARLACLRGEDLSPITGAGIPVTLVDAVFQGAQTRLSVRPVAQPDIAFTFGVDGAPPPGPDLVVTVRDGWVLPIRP